MLFSYIRFLGGKNMKNKIICIFMIVLIMIMIPVVAGATVHKDTQPSKIGWTTIQGFISKAHKINGGALIEFECLFVHYACQGLGQRVTGFRSGWKTMAIPAIFKGILTSHIIIGYCVGVLEF